MFQKFFYLIQFMLEFQSKWHFWLIFPYGNSCTVFFSVFVLNFSLFLIFVLTCLNPQVLYHMDLASQFLLQNVTLFNIKSIVAVFLTRDGQFSNFQVVAPRQPWLILSSFVIADQGLDPEKCRMSCNQTFTIEKPTEVACLLDAIIWTATTVSHSESIGVGGYNNFYKIEK